MQIRALIMLAVALVLGGITVFLVNNFLQSEVGDQGRVQKLRTVPVVVAAQDIKSGTKLESVMLTAVDWPSETVPDGVYTDVATVIGEKPPVLLQETKRGEVILPYKLSPHGARGGLPARIPEDMRATTIPVSEITGVAGFIAPGDFVDVLHTSAVGRSDELPVTRVLMQNVQVLGIDQISSQDDAKPKIVNAVTLLVNPESGQRLTLALATGSLSLLLRNEFDASLLATKDIAWRQLVPEEAVAVVEQPRVVRRERRVVTIVKQQAPATAVPAKTSDRVEVIRGLNVSRQDVPSTPAANDATSAKPDEAKP
ncbi:MAG: Flp pilus assembly protein CpaB [Moraxellaceae bacterium]|nr:Flp pilus assembly protein CpaB [Moraxellaceae bacterium]